MKGTKRDGGTRKVRQEAESQGLPPSSELELLWYLSVSHTTCLSHTLPVCLTRYLSVPLATCLCPTLPVCLPRYLSVSHDRLLASSSLCNAAFAERRAAEGHVRATGRMPLRRQGAAALHRSA